MFYQVEVAELFMMKLYDPLPNEFRNKMYESWFVIFMEIKLHVIASVSVNFVKFLWN